MPRARDSLFDLRGCRALVTGASQGLGLGIAEALVAHGAGVLVCDTDREACVRTARCLGNSAQFLPAFAADPTNPADLEALRSAAGRVDILVCTAPAQGKVDPGEAPDDALQRQLRTAQSLCAMMIPGMARRGRGSVVLVLSSGQAQAGRSCSVDTLFRNAWVKLVRHLAMQWGPRGVRINAVSAGLIQPLVGGGLFGAGDALAKRLAHAPLRRIGRVEELAGAVIFLASQAAGFVTGHDLVVDGGALVSDNLLEGATQPCIS